MREPPPFLPRGYHETSYPMVQEEPTDGSLPQRVPCLRRSGWRRRNEREESVRESYPRIRFLVTQCARFFNSPPISSENTCKKGEKLPNAMLSGSAFTNLFNCQCGLGRWLWLSCHLIAQ